MVLLLLVLLLFMVRHYRARYLVRVWYTDLVVVVVVCRLMNLTIEFDLFMCSYEVN